MTREELQEIVFNTLEQHGEEEGRRILVARLQSDPVFNDAAIRYGLEILQGVAESQAAPKQ